MMQLVGLAALVLLSSAIWRRYRPLSNDLAPMSEAWIFARHREALWDKTHAHYFDTGFGK